MKARRGQPVLLDESGLACPDVVVVEGEVEKLM
jgi:hypothetical protein